MFKSKEKGGSREDHFTEDTPGDDAGDRT